MVEQRTAMTNPVSVLNALERMARL